MTAQSRREDAVGVGAARLWGFSWSPQRTFNLEGLTIQLESFAEGFVALFQPSSFGICAVLGRDSVFLEEGFWGVFRRWSICFMVSGFCPGQSVQAVYRFSAHSAKGISP